MKDRVVFKFIGFHIEGEGKPAHAVTWIGGALLALALICTLTGLARSAHLPRTGALAQPLDAAASEATKVKNGVAGMS